MIKLQYILEGMVQEGVEVKVVDRTNTRGYYSITLSKGPLTIKTRLGDNEVLLSELEDKIVKGALVAVEEFMFKKGAMI